LTNYHTMKMYWGSGGIAPPILNLVAVYVAEPQIMGKCRLV